MKNSYFLVFFTLILFYACQNAETGQDQDPAVQEEAVVLEEAEASGKIIFFGNSLTAANGLDPGEGFPAIIQTKLDESGFNYKVVNAGLSGETSAGGNERVDWVLQQDVDVFVLELGGNDGLRGFAPEVTSKNLQAIIDKVKAKAPEAAIILAGMEAPPNMGQDYTDAFRNIFVQLARDNDLSLIPFLLKNVGGVPELNLPDGIHPNQEGQKIVAENVWEVLQPLLEEKES